MIKNLLNFCLTLKIVSSKTVTLLSTVNSDGSIRTDGGEFCVSTLYGMNGNSHLEILPCFRYGNERLNPDMKFQYDPVKKNILQNGLCWNVNKNGIVNLRTCKNTARNNDSKQIFHVMRNETSRVLVPGGQNAGMCIGYENNDEQFKDGMELVTVFDCDMTGYSIDF